MFKNYGYKFNREKCWYLNKCEHADNPEVCQISCVRYFKMDYLMYCSNIPKKSQGFEKVTKRKGDEKVFDDLVKLKKDLLNWVNQGNNLYLWSEGFGNGKTSWALKLLKNYFNLIWPTTDFVCRGLFISIPVFMRAYKDQFKKQDEYFDFLLENIPEADIVVWDDVGYASVSDADFKILSSFIEERYLNEKSNIFTGNLNRDELITQLGKRMTSRIWDKSEHLEFKSSDFRGFTER